MIFNALFFDLLSVFVEMQEMGTWTAFLLTFCNFLFRNRHVPPERQHFRNVPVGPMTFKRFLEIFRYLYTNKCNERETRVSGLRKVLLAIDQSRHDSQVMGKAITDIKRQYEEACATSAKLMAELTAKATRLEKLKAQFGRSGALNAFLQLNELEEENDEEDDSLLNEGGEPDELDKEFDRLREESLKTRQFQARLVFLKI